MMLRRQEAIDLLNKLSRDSTPFFFFTDFLGLEAFVSSVADLTADIRFQFGVDAPAFPKLDGQFLKSNPISYTDFLHAFEGVKKEISLGNSFLTNLTFCTPIESDNTLLEIFSGSRAKYKVYCKNRFVCFSPETFVRISADGLISSYPMKGTMDASLPRAEERLLEDPKELAEHITIVDLIRNDLSQVADQVTVRRFRYLDRVVTSGKVLLQASSEIVGQLPGDWRRELGTILFQLLPAGSISGAPKPQTIEIISQYENYVRGFYTGICGFFDGQALDCGVMIRFIEQDNGKLYYKSGAGITAFSDPKKEYQEIQDKIYVPIH